MTREDAIRTLKEHKITFQHDFGWNASTLEAIEMAIKALEQSNSDEDCISRKSVLNTLDSMDKVLTENRTVEEYKAVLEECYKVLPSIQPKAKVGHWILTQRGNFIDIDCSECKHTRVEDFAYGYKVSEIDSQGFKDYIVRNKLNYCENCGAKMEDYEET